MEMLLLQPLESTKLCQQKPLDLKDDNTEKHCPVTVNPWHMKKAFKVLNELRSQNLLCDVTIVAEDIEIAAHRVVLAACSPYFHAMFTGEMSESQAKKVRIKEVDGWTLKMLIEYVYTAKITVTEENVQEVILFNSTIPAFLMSKIHPENNTITEPKSCYYVNGGDLMLRILLAEKVLLPAASLLQLQDVRKSCCDFLETQLHPVNCLGIRAFADMHACTKLLNKANTYADASMPALHPKKASRVGVKQTSLCKQ